MNNNQEIVENWIITSINALYKEKPPTEIEFLNESNKIRKITRELYPLSDDDFNSILRKIMSSMLVIMDDGYFIYDPNSSHRSWLPARRAKSESIYWERYKRYLELEKGWNSRVTAKLDKVSDEIVDLLGDPKDIRKIFQRRGLVLGDVQSGKTANYTAICNKAADHGYKVIIILAGMMENLRIQTQERLDTEFAGRKSNFYLDPKLDKAIKNQPFGVGKYNSTKRISCFTSVTKDFNINILKSNDLTLKNISEPVIFIVKKNKNILNNLYNWLVNNNGDLDNMIDLPLLLIDDEADNASINTNTDDKDSTAINKAIRNILNSFYKASYIGITATPFANIFINPNDKNDMIGDDLFPKDFIYVLLPPSNYIGPNDIFGNDNIYENSLIKIYNEEMSYFFPFKHKKELEVNSLPPSMLEAIGYFIIANAIRDIRKDSKEHRSMLINVTRFTDIQNKISELINEWLIIVKSDLRNYASLDDYTSSKIKNIKFLKAIWDKYDMEMIAGCKWEHLLGIHLYSSTAPIDVRAINQKSSASSLNYNIYKETGLRVIAVGGNSLSRGLTLEGLCVSYFYRNSQMYDTLLQMGRWFGYRPNYDDIFKIWMAEDAIDWYGYITEATNELKDEIATMRSLNQTPSEFGLKVRQDPRSLIATARNKMRTAELVSRPITVSGRLLETPRLINKKEILENNERTFKSLVSKLINYNEIEISQNARLWRGIPKEFIIYLLRSFDTHPWHLSFQGRALADYIEDVDDLLYWDVAIPQGLGTKYQMNIGDKDINIKPAIRTITYDDKTILISGTKVKVGAGGSTRIGLSDLEIETAKNIFKKEKGNKSISDSAYLIKGRYPLLLLHVIETQGEKGKKLPDSIPEHIFALGIGFPASDDSTKVANYIINMVEQRNWMEVNEEEDDDYYVNS